MFLLMLLTFSPSRELNVVEVKMVERPVGWRQQFSVWEGTPIADRVGLFMVIEKSFRPKDAKQQEAHWYRLGPELHRLLEYGKMIMPFVQTDDEIRRDLAPRLRSSGWRVAYR